MRHLPHNSPEAAARLVGLILIADGMASAKEFTALQSLDAERRLSLQPGQLKQVLQQLCEDLQQRAGGCWNGQADLEGAELDDYLEEVSDPALRETVLSLALAVAEADAHLSDAECQMLAHTMWRWKLNRASQLLKPGQEAPASVY